jgi:hypothetical protein
MYDQVTEIFHKYYDLIPFPEPCKDRTTTTTELNILVTYCNFHYIPGQWISKCLQPTILQSEYRRTKIEMLMLLGQGTDT